jgi:hypothetical protein
MPKSRNRYSRAALRSKYRKPKRRRGGSLAWNSAIAVIVIAGVLAIVFTRSSNEAAAGARPRVADAATGQPVDHWHTYVGVDICGEWLDNPPAFEKAFDNPSGVKVGIHSHGDGLIHTHPFYSSEAGGSATVGKFFDYGGWSVSSSSIDLGGANSAHVQWKGPASDPTKTTWSSGDKCPFGEFKGQKGVIRWAIDGVEQHGNPADYHQKDGATLAIYFVPKNAALTFPPGACSALTAISDINGQPDFDAHSPCLTSTTTTTTSSSTTTAPPGTTTSTP